MIDKQYKNYLPHNNSHEISSSTKTTHDIAKFIIITFIY